MRMVLIIVIVAGMCEGCYTLPLWTPVCSHSDQPVYTFKHLSDGHHFIFDSQGAKLTASVYTKNGCLSGRFEIYYSTGTLKYWGMLDSCGHVVSGSYNDTSTRMSDYNVRSMTVADEQNAQTELVEILKNGVIKTKTPNGGNVPNNDESSIPNQSAALTLFDCTHSTIRPTIGSIYEHDGKGLQVFQAIEGAVMVNAKLDLNSSNIIDTAQNRLNIIVETTMKYVDGEMLAPGKYEYTGPYKYETILEEKRTIRRFKQIE